MLNRILPTLAVTVGSFVVGRLVRYLTEKAEHVARNQNAPKKSAPKDLGALDYDPDTDSYRPKSSS